VLSSPSPILTARLALVSMSDAFMRASVEGQLERATGLLGVDLPPDWPVGAEHALRLRIEQLAADPSSQPWLLRAIVLRERPHMIGRIGFHAPPTDDGSVEIGYAISPTYRRHGYAEEATRAMFAWAQQQRAISRFVASVSPSNEPSLNLVRKLGFQQVGAQLDEIDGEELVFELLTHR
jgi:[ribosomal protein S5]-alanine N-acetyltransferase